MKKLLLLGLIVLSTCAVFAQVPEPLPNTYVNDLSGKLSADQIQQLNLRIQSIEKKCSVQVAIVLVDKLPENMEIDQFTLEIGRKWHVGHAHNGLVYAAAISQRKQRLEVADNMQGVITDADALHITDDLKPFFRSGDYYGGLNNLLDNINQHVDPEVQAQLKLAEAERDKIREKQWETVKTVLMWIFIVLLAAFTVFWYCIRPGILKRREEERLKEEELQKKINESIKNNAARTKASPPPPGPSRRTEIPTTVLPTPSVSSDDDSYSRRSSSRSDDDNNNSNFGNWGSGSSDDNSSSFGFSGGGASNDW